MKKIIDGFTDLDISRQRKWQLRHPDQVRAIESKYRHGSGRVLRNSYMRHLMHSRTVPVIKYQDCPRCMV